MDPSLRKGREDFKKRALAAAQKPKRAKDPAVKARVRADPVIKQKRSVKKDNSSADKSTLNSLQSIKEAAKAAHDANHPHRVLKCIIDMLKMRYINRNYTEMSLDEILAVIELLDIRNDMRKWLRDALLQNTKVQFYLESETFLFKPALGHQVRNKKELIAMLRELDLKGLGGVTQTDVQEVISDADRIVKRLIEKERVICITRQDKEEVLYYNTPDLYTGQPLSAQLQALWHRGGVEGMTETDIERYLDNVGLGAMQGEGRKRKAPGSAQKRARKKMKATKVQNTHLDTELIDYSAGADSQI